MPATSLSILREPLVQFAAVGLVLFGLDRALAPVADDPRMIDIGLEEYERFSELWQSEKGRLPTPDDMDRMVDRWLDTEAMYREALDLKLERGDDMIRERLAQRIRVMIYSGIDVEDPGDEVLRGYVEEHGERYVQPATVSVRVIGIDATEAEAGEVAAEANKRMARGEVIARPGLPLVNFRSRPRDQLVRLLDEDFVSAVEAAPLEVWTPVPSSRGWQVVQHLGSRPRLEPEFDQIRDRALADWKEGQKHREARAGLEALKASFPVRRAPYPEDLVAGPASEAGSGTDE